MQTVLDALGITRREEPGLLLLEVQALAQEGVEDTGGGERVVCGGEQESGQFLPGKLRARFLLQEFPQLLEANRLGTRTDLGT